MGPISVNGKSIMISSRRAFFQKIIFLVLISGFMMAALGIGVKPQRHVGGRIQPDELLYVYGAGVFRSVFITHDWDIELIRSDIRYGAVPFGAYVIGAMTYFSPYRAFLVEPKEMWLFASKDGIPDNHSDRDIISHPFSYVREMVAVLRERLLIFRAAVCGLFFMITFFCGGFFCAVPATMMLLRDETFIGVSSLVLLDTIWLTIYFFDLLLIFLYLFLWQKRMKSLMGMLVLASGIGIITGLLAATKIHGVLNIAVYWVTFSVVLFQRASVKEASRECIYRGCWHMFVSACCCLLVFIIINPVLYQHPFQGISQIVQQRFLNFSTQIQYQESLYLVHVWDRLKFIIHIAHVFNMKGLLLLTGFFFLCWDIRDDLICKRRLGMRFVMAVSFLLYFFVILKYMFMAYDWYVLMLLPYFFFFMVYGVYGPAIRLWKK